IRIESRRSAESSVRVSLGRMIEQRAQLEQSRQSLAAELAGVDGPILELQARLDESLARRLEVEAELGEARRALEEADATLRTLDEQRMLAERRVGEAREAMEAARLAAQENRVRREGLAEQFAETHFELAEVQQSLAADAAIPVWEERLIEARAGIERLG